MDDPRPGVMCTRCHHLWDPHVLVAPDGDPTNGGYIYCPVEGCDCHFTWSVG